MGSILAADIQTRILTTLQDPNAVRWTKSELLKWHNDAQREIVKYRPDASTIHRIQLLVTGTKQALNAGDLRMLRGLRNMGADGATVGVAVRTMEREAMDVQNPNWHADTASAVVERVIYDEEDPKVFYVYPPQPGAGQGYLEVIDSTPPAECTINGVDGAGASTPISVDDTYANDLFNYVMGKALAKEAEYANPMAGNAYFQLFTQSMGVKAGADSAADPNKRENGK